MSVTVPMTQAVKAMPTPLYVMYAQMRRPA